MYYLAGLLEVQLIFVLCLIRAFLVMTGHLFIALHQELIKKPEGL